MQSLKAKNVISYLCCGKESVSVSAAFAHATGCIWIYFFPTYSFFKEQEMPMHRSSYALQHNPSLSLFSSSLSEALCSRKPCQTNENGTLLESVFSSLL